MAPEAVGTNEERRGGLRLLCLSHMRCYPSIEVPVFSLGALSFYPNCGVTSHDGRCDIENVLLECMSLDLCPVGHLDSLGLGSSTARLAINQVADDRWCGKRGVHLAAVDLE